MDFLVVKIVHELGYTAALDCQTGQTKADITKRSSYSYSPRCSWLLIFSEISCHLAISVLPETHIIVIIFSV